MKFQPNENKDERMAFAAEMFRQQLKERKPHEQALSVPKVNKALKKEFGTMSNAQELYQLRLAIFDEFGLDKHGVPVGARPLIEQLQKVNLAPAAEVRNRNPDEDPLFNTKLMPIDGLEQGAFLKRTFDTLRRYGFVDIRVVDMTERYAVIERVQAQEVEPKQIVLDIPAHPNGVVNMRPAETFQKSGRTYPAHCQYKGCAEKHDGPRYRFMCRKHRK